MNTYIVYNIYVRTLSYDFSKLYTFFGKNLSLVTKLQCELLQQVWLMMFIYSVTSTKLRNEHLNPSVAYVYRNMNLNLYILYIIIYNYIYIYIYIYI